MRLISLRCSSDLSPAVAAKKKKGYIVATFPSRSRLPRLSCWLGSSSAGAMLGRRLRRATGEDKTCTTAAGAAGAGAARVHVLRLPRAPWHVRGTDNGQPAGQG